MTPRDMNKATIGQSGNRDIPGSKCGIRVYTFKRKSYEILNKQFI